MPAQNLHWVKAPKPVSEMSQEERKAFAELLAQRALENALANSKPFSAQESIQQTGL